MSNSVLFFTQNRWAFGQIHYALIKHLWNHGIYSNLLDWTVHYTQKEHEYLRRSYRLIYTTPESVYHLVAYGWPVNRIASVAHCEIDLTRAVTNSGIGMFDELYAFGVVNPQLIDTAKQLGIRRTPVLVRVGLDTEHFAAPLPTALKVVGYAGAKTFALTNGIDCKRGHLAEQAILKSNLVLKNHEFHHHFSMPGYYRDVDAILVSSDYETVGLPGLEAASAGRLVISTEVGYFDGSYGVKCRTDEQGFTEDAVRALTYFSSHPEVFREACFKYRNAVREKHDWTRHAQTWANFLE